MNDLCPRCNACQLVPDDDHFRCLVCGLICDVIDRGEWFEVELIV